MDIKNPTEEQTAFVKKFIKHIGEGMMHIEDYAGTFCHQEVHKKVVEMIAWVNQMVITEKTLEEREKTVAEVPVVEAVIEEVN